MARISGSGSIIKLDISFVVVQRRLGGHKSVNGAEEFTVRRPLDLINRSLFLQLNRLALSFLRVEKI